MSEAPRPREIRNQPPPRTADLVVIGGGIVGAASAFFAARSGLDTVVLERRPALATLSTAAATGAFRLQFDNREELTLVRESLEFYRAFAERTGLLDWSLEMREGGYLWVATEPATAARQRTLVERQRAWGLDDVELLEGEALRRRFPYLAGDVLQARFRAGDGWLDARRLALGFARASGATFVLGVAARRIEPVAGGALRVVTDGGPVDAGAVLVAAGSFTAALLSTVGIALPIRLLRRHRLVLLDAPEVPAAAPMTIDEETGAHWRPAGSGAHLMWPDPAAPEEEPLEDVAPAEDFAFRVLDPTSPASVARIAPFWRAVWERGTSPWLLKAGQYDLTPDHRPWLGATSIPGLHVNGGYSGHGVMSAAAGSRIAVDSVLGRLDPARNPFRTDRPLEPRPRDVL